MKRKIALIAVCLLAIATAGFAYANTEYIALEQDTVRSGGYISFSVDVSAIDDEDYSLVLSIAPDVDSISVKQNVNAVVNGSMVTVSSANLEDIDTLDFKVYPGEVTDETEYEITAELLTESGITKLDTAKFKAVLAEDDNSKDMDDREDRTDASVNDENDKKDESGIEKREQTDKGENKSETKTGKGTTGTSSQTDETLVYQGSWDNYLGSLSVEGYEFTQSFNKTNDTYFIKAKKGTEKVGITATPTDPDATVVITGNENLEKGRNKVLVNVTAENGNVRVYRIYVDVEE